MTRQHTPPQSARASSFSRLHNHPQQHTQSPSATHTITLSNTHNHPQQHTQSPSATHTITLSNTHNHPQQHTQSPSATHTITISNTHNLRSPLKDWSVLRRDLFLKTQNTRNRQISIPQVGFEPAISTTEQQQIHTLDLVAKYVLFVWYLKYRKTHVNIKLLLYNRNILLEQIVEDTHTTFNTAHSIRLCHATKQVCND